MNGAGHHLLARARLAEEEHGQSARGHAPHEGKHPHRDRVFGHDVFAARGAAEDRAGRGGVSAYISDDEARVAQANERPGGHTTTALQPLLAEEGAVAAAQVAHDDAARLGQEREVSARDAKIVEPNLRLVAAPHTELLPCVEHHHPRRSAGLLHEDARLMGAHLGPLLRR